MKPAKAQIHGILNRQNGLKHHYIDKSIRAFVQVDPLFGTSKFFEINLSPSIRSIFIGILIISKCQNLPNFIWGYILFSMLSYTRKYSMYHIHSTFHFKFHLFMKHIIEMICQYSMKYSSFIAQWNIYIAAVCTWKLHIIAVISLSVYNCPHYFSISHPLYFTRPFHLTSFSSFPYDSHLFYLFRFRPFASAISLHKF